MISATAQRKKGETKHPNNRVSGILPLNLLNFQVFDIQLKWSSSFATHHLNGMANIWNLSNHSAVDNIHENGHISSHCSKKYFHSRGFLRTRKKKRNLCVCTKIKAHNENNILGPWRHPSHHFGCYICSEMKRATICPRHNSKQWKKIFVSLQWIITKDAWVKK